MTPTSLSNLVPDIYKVIDEGIQLTDTEKQKLGASLASAVLQGIGKQVHKPELRMSNFGSKCERQLWYRVNRADLAEKLEPYVKFKFAYGHILEALTIWLAKKAGHTVTGEQDELVIEGIKGHRDAVIDGVLVDVKSANSRGFLKFKDHALLDDDPFGYMAQLSLYSYASRDDPLVEVKKEAAFLAIDKEQGHIVLDKYKVLDKDYDKEVKSKKEMLERDTPPKRAYLPEADGLSGNQKLGTACSYCAYKEECWKESNQGQGLRKFFYSNAPRWLVHVAKEPKVQEAR